MARPTKSALLIDKYSQTKSEINSRIKKESDLRGDSQKLKPPNYLNLNQHKVFDYIVEQLDKSGILGNLDVYILTTCVIAIDRLQVIEKMINENIGLLSDNKFMSSKEKYTKDLYRCCNELSLSPQSRAKIANINMDAKEDDSLLRVLGNGH